MNNLSKGKKLFMLGLQVHQQNVSAFKYMGLCSSAIRHRNITSTIFIKTQKQLPNPTSNVCGDTRETPPDYTQTRCRSTAIAQDHSTTLRPWKEIPGPRCLPILKNLPYSIYGLPKQFTDFPATICHLYEKYGEIARFEFPFAPKMLFLSDPDLMEAFVKDAVTDWPERMTLESFVYYRTKLRKDVFGDCAGIAVENGQRWYEVRSKVQQTMMRPKTSTLYIPAMDAIAQDFIQLIKRIRDDKMEAPKDFQNEIYKWALESVCVVAFNARMGCLDPHLPADSDGQKMISSVNQILRDIANLEFGSNLWRIFPTKTWKSFVKHNDIVYGIARKHVEKAAAVLNKKRLHELEDMNMLERFLMTPGLSKGNAYTMAMDMLFAGIDTTGNAMGYLLYCLAKNPKQQKILQKEIDDVLPDASKPVTPSVINSVPYVKACVKESMRLYPIVSGFARIAQKDTAIKGYFIPQGTLVMCNTLLMGHQDKYYPEAMKFKPERWLRGHPEQTDASPYTFLPFGQGTRMCVGRRIAEQEMFVLAIKIFRNFNVEYHYKEMGYEARLLNVPNEPLQFRFIDRK